MQRLRPQGYGINTEESSTPLSQLLVEYSKKIKSLRTGDAFLDNSQYTKVW